MSGSAGSKREGSGTTVMEFLHLILRPVCSVPPLLTRNPGPEPPLPPPRPCTSLLPPHPWTA
ncbi:Hypothetical predicted protein [Marmota monax]|uniref:Uncharacterized protein n=1 Tax=Marmota monax TaxID=9995 RepID=A0A5E4CDF2_MARMO|nr:hypothetical protein GHT09_003404 [Marmota monax]VTJ78882.1 Hypothetical predicted protein [Marmota monax]